MMLMHMWRGIAVIGRAERATLVVDSGGIFHTARRSYVLLRASVGVQLTDTICTSVQRGRQTERPAVESPHHREARLFQWRLRDLEQATLLLFKEVNRQRPPAVESDRVLNNRTAHWRLQGYECSPWYTFGHNYKQSRDRNVLARLKTSQTNFLSQLRYSIT